MEGSAIVDVEGKGGVGVGGELDGTGVVATDEQASVSRRSEDEEGW